MNVQRGMVTILLVALVAGGCGKKAPPPPAPTSDPAADAREAEARARREAEERARREAEERARREAEERTRREAELATMRRSLEEVVFFDYDMSVIKTEAKPILDAKVRILRDNPAIRILIEGHCDERGSNEYNLALGSRRADAVRAYMTAAGIRNDRFQIISYGEERPLTQGSNETAWARNRRAQFQVQAGLGTR